VPFPSPERNSGQLKEIALRSYHHIQDITAGRGKDLGRKARAQRAFLPSRKKIPRSLRELGSQM
jgi:hypothetical protein